METSHKYFVTLTKEERQILLKLMKPPENRDWTYQKIREGFRGNSSYDLPGCKAVCYRRYIDTALGRKEQENRHRKIDSNVEAHIIVVACSDPPEGHSS